MAKIDYVPQGVCSKRMVIDVDDETGEVRQAMVIGGCHGNLQGVCRLIEGMKVDDVVSKLRGIRCGMKETSCPDQLARALEEHRGR